MVECGQRQEHFQHSQECVCCGVGVSSFTAPKGTPGETMTGSPCSRFPPPLWAPPVGGVSRLVVSGWQIAVTPQTQGPVWMALPVRGPTGFVLTPQGHR